jgi:hypothetical protein
MTQRGQDHFVLQDRLAVSASYDKFIFLQRVDLPDWVQSSSCCDRSEDCDGPAGAESGLRPLVFSKLGQGLWAGQSNAETSTPPTLTDREIDGPLPHPKRRPD